MLTHARLLEVLEYDQETGIFKRKISTGSRTKAGDIAGYIDSSHGYVSMGVDGREYYGHRLAWYYMTGEWPASQIDHENTIRSDNRWLNLRQATQGQNKKNLKLRANNTSGVKGVTWHAKAGKWMAQINCDGKHFYLGCYETIDEARDAYAKASQEKHGDFGRVADAS